jgi:hypothetical protein
LDTRDYAEQGRNSILNSLLATKGPEGWAAKLEMAHDPLFGHFKDRAIVLANEAAAEEADSEARTEADCVSLEKYGEAPPATRDAMFSLMRDRLDDIDDLLLQDISPREMWASITDEKLLRRELAREFSNRSNNAYRVDQEAVTADEKETDVRLRSTTSGQQGTIELKVGDNRTALDLRDTLNNQLIEKYMAADDCKAGCLLVSISKDRKWEHPDTGKRLDVDGLNAVLQEEAERLELELGGAVKLMARLLDLRPRLMTEKNAAKQSPRVARKKPKAKKIEIKTTTSAKKKTPAKAKGKGRPAQRKQKTANARKLTTSKAKRR